MDDLGAEVKHDTRDLQRRVPMKVPLADVAQITMGQSPPSMTYNRIGTGLPFFQGKTDFGDLFPVVRMFCSDPAKVAEAHDILISVRAPVGPTNLAPTRCCIGRGLASIRPTDKLNLKYALYYLRFAEPKLADSGRGSTFESINREDLELFPIPLPPLPEQKRIAAILGNADRIRRVRRYAREMSEGFLESVFREMFGTELMRKAGWPRVTVEELAADIAGAIRTGPFGSQLLHAEFLDVGPVAVLMIDNVVNNRFEPKVKRFISQEKYQALKRYTVRPGDVLITIMGTCGRCAVVPADIGAAINTKHLCCITLDDRRCIPTYLLGCLLFDPDVRHQLGVKQHGAIMDALNMQLIKELVIAVPPVAMQQGYSNALEKAEKLRLLHVEAERQAEHLFQSLLAKAFGGEY